MFLNFVLPPNGPRRNMFGRLWVETKRANERNPTLGGLGAAGGAEGPKTPEKRPQEGFGWESPFPGKF